MKTLKIAVLAAGVLLLAGCGNKAVQNTTDNGADNANAPKTENQGGMSGVISSMQDAMASGKMMKCTYTIKDSQGNNLETTTYVDGKKYKSDMTVAGNVQHMLFDGDTMYSWVDEQKAGMKMATACSAELAANDQAPNTPALDTTGEKTFDNATDVKCIATSGVDFSIPTDVIFSDQCEMLKNLQKNIPTLPTNMPSVSSGMPQL